MRSKTKEITGHFFKDRIIGIPSGFVSDHFSCKRTLQHEQQNLPKCNEFKEPLHLSLG